MVMTQTAKTTARPRAAHVDGEGQEPDPPSLRTLAARRREAEATVEALAAQERAAHVSAEATDAQERAAREGARARTAELGAELDRLDRWAEEQRQREYREWHQAYERRQAAMEQLRALAEEPLPHIPQSLDEHRANLAQLDAYVDRAQQAERDEQRAYIDRCEGRRLWDHAFRARYDFHHPGGADRCDCRGHRIWRGEEL